MADIKPIKPIKLCVNITIPTIDDDSISLYECVGILGNKLQEAIQKINESFGSLEGAYTAANPPPYPVTSVNGKTGAVIIDIPENVYTVDNPPPYPVTSVNRAETKDVITVFEPEGGGIEDVSQAELIAACKAGARLGAFNQDDGTCRLYHFNLYIDPERVDYKEVAGGGASGVQSINDQTGAVNIFNAPINAATQKSVTDLTESTNTKINQLKTNISAKADKSIVSDAWQTGVTYDAGAYCIYNDNLYRALVQTTAEPTIESDWKKCVIMEEIPPENRLIIHNQSDSTKETLISLIVNAIENKKGLFSIVGSWKQHPNGYSAIVNSGSYDPTSQRYGGTIYAFDGTGVSFVSHREAEQITSKFYNFTMN